MHKHSITAHVGWEWGGAHRPVASHGADPGGGTARDIAGSGSRRRPEATKKRGSKETKHYDEAEREAGNGHEYPPAVDVAWSVPLPYPHSGTLSIHPVSFSAVSRYSSPSSPAARSPGSRAP